MFTQFTNPNAFTLRFHAIRDRRRALARPRASGGTATPLRRALAIVLSPPPSAQHNALKTTIENSFHSFTRDRIAAYLTFDDHEPFGEHF